MVQGASPRTGAGSGGRQVGRARLAQQLGLAAVAGGAQVLVLGETVGRGEVRRARRAPRVVERSTWGRGTVSG